MCIIAAKPAGVAMPGESTLSNMWYSNYDGAGFMYASKGYVHIVKGFMTYQDFTSALDDLKKKHNLKDLPLVMHFRITTHGGTKPENCHPFPISDSVGVLSKPVCKTKLGVAHNGIIDITPRKGISDTMEYIASQLAPLSRAVPEFYRNKDLMQMINNAIHSRMAFLNSKGEIFTVGDFIEEAGILYSNRTYQKASYRDFSWNYNGGYSGWGDYDSDYGYTMASGMTDGYLDDYNPWHKGTFHTETVMWLDANDMYVRDEEGELSADDDAFAIDKDGTVYAYDCEVDALVKMPGASAWTNNETRVRFDLSSNFTIREMVFVPDTKKKNWGGH